MVCGQTATCADYCTTPTIWRENRRILKGLQEDACNPKKESKWSSCGGGPPPPLPQVVVGIFWLMFFIPGIPFAFFLLIGFIGFIFS